MSTMQSSLTPIDHVGLVRRLAEAARRITCATDESELREVVRSLAFPALGIHRIELEASGELVIAEGRIDTAEAHALRDGLAELVEATLPRIRRPVSADSIYFEQLFHAAPEAIVVLDRGDRVVRVNREFERMFGYTAEEAHGRTVNDLIVPEELRTSAANLTYAVARGEHVVEEGVRRRKDGTVVNVSILGTPVMVEGDQVAVYGIYRDITEQKETEEALRRLSTTDDLTGLFNRRGFFIVAEQQRRLAIRRRAELLLLYIDIDDFKSINDTFGHQEGDRVLADIGALLRDCYRDSDILARVTGDEGLLARMGGDEFVVLAVDAGEEGQRILTTRLQERLREYNEGCKDRYTVSLSVGVVRVQPEPNVTIDALLAAADRRMYENKRERL